MVSMGQGGWDDKGRIRRPRRDDPDLDGVFRMFGKSRRIRFYCYWILSRNLQDLKMESWR